MLEQTDITTIQEAFKSGGWLGAAAAVVLLILKLYRSTTFQNAVASAIPALAWDRMSRWTRIGLVSGVSMIAAFLNGLAAGKTWVTALLGTIPVLLASIGSYELKTTVDKALVEGRNLSIIHKTPQK